MTALPAVPAVPAIPAPGGNGPRPGTPAQGFADVLEAATAVLEAATAATARPQVREGDGGPESAGTGRAPEGEAAGGRAVREDGTEDVTDGGTADQTADAATGPVVPTSSTPPEGVDLTGLGIAEAVAAAPSELAIVVADGAADGAADEGDLGADVVAIDDAVEAALGRPALDPSTAVALAGHPASTELPVGQVDQDATGPSGPPGPQAGTAAQPGAPDASADGLAVGRQGTAPGLLVAAAHVPPASAGSGQAASAPPRVAAAEGAAQALTTAPASEADQPPTATALASPSDAGASRTPAASTATSTAASTAASTATSTAAGASQDLAADDPGDAPAALVGGAPQTAPATPAAPAAPAAVAATAAATTPGTLPPGVSPSAQLASAVAALRRGEDGVHQMSLELHPAELGRVHVEVEVRAGVVNLRLAAEQASTRALLGSSMGELRSALEHGGLSAGSMDLSEGGWGGPGDRDQPGQGGGPRFEAADPTQVIPLRAVPHQHRTATSVDLLV